LLTPRPRVLRALAQRGRHNLFSGVALIIGLYGITVGVITNAVYSAIVFMAFLTTIMTPFILNRLYSEEKIKIKKETFVKIKEK